MQIQHPILSVDSKIRFPGQKGSSRQKNGQGKRLDGLIASLRQATITGNFIPGTCFQVTWSGAQLLTLNEMLRLDYRVLHSYREACHAAALDAVYAIARRKQGIQFHDPLRLSIFRSGRKYFDNDGLYASFKFLIDGFRHAGLIANDDPTIISEMAHRQSIGDPAVGLCFDRVT